MNVDDSPIIKIISRYHIKLKILSHIKRMIIKYCVVFYFIYISNCAAC